MLYAIVIFVKTEVVRSTRSLSDCLDANEKGRVGKIN